MLFIKHQFNKGVMLVFNIILEIYEISEQSANSKMLMNEVTD